MKHIIFFIIILIVIIIFLYSYNIKESFINSEIIIPKVIISTYHTKKKIPSKVYNNIKKYAPNYKHIIFDDNDIVIFLKKYYGPKILEAFHNLKGPHKADLFRYCYLYKFGGIYLDIKTELIKNIDNIFNRNNIHLYTIISRTNYTIHQGVIASVPKNSIFINLINYIVKINKPVKKYFAFTIDFYNELKKIYGVNRLYNGKFSNNEGNNSYLFYEKCTKNPTDCHDGLDRYNGCCYIYDKGIKVIKTRYSDYPW